MKNHRVLILGNSLLAEGIAELLGDSQAVQVIGTAAKVDEVLALLAEYDVDALIVMGTDDQATARYGQIMAQYPDLPLIRADISQNKVRVFTSQSIDANPGALIEAISSLPKRNEGWSIDTLN
jgi:DNA-binding NarL/FixJ family response regulator